MLPLVRHVQEACQPDRATVVADVGMFSADNKKAIIEAGLG
nr:hypothetical protein [Corynebacterium glutamicum]